MSLTKLYIYIYIYMYITCTYTKIYIHLYIYIYINRGLRTWALTFARRGLSIRRLGSGFGVERGSGCDTGLLLEGTAAGPLVFRAGSGSSGSLICGFIVEDRNRCRYRFRS